MTRGVSHYRRELIIDDFLLFKLIETDRFNLTELNLDSCFSKAILCRSLLFMFLLFIQLGIRDDSYCCITGGFQVFIDLCTFFLNHFGKAWILVGQTIMSF